MRIIQKKLVLIICLMLAFAFYCTTDNGHEAEAETEVSFIDEKFYPPIELSEDSVIEKINIPIPIEESIIEESIVEVPDRTCASVDDFYYYTTFIYNGAVQKPSRLTKEEQRYIYEMCQKYELEYELVLALMGAEATWNLYIGGDNGYCGIGQISEALNLQPFLDIGLDIRDPFQAVECVCIILQNKYSVYKDWEMTLIAYNKGNNGAQSNYFDYGIYTTSYSRKVLGLRDLMLELKGGTYGANNRTD